MAKFEHKVYSPNRSPTLVACTFPLSSSGTTATYNWAAGLSGSTATRNNSGSWTVNLDRTDFISGSVSLTLQLPDSHANDEDVSYSLKLYQFYPKESGSFNVEAFTMSGSTGEVRSDIDGATCHVVGYFTDVPDKNNY